MKSFKTWFWFWLVAALIGCYIRLYPLRAHLWDETYDQATLTVVFNIKKSLLEQIHTQAPQIPPAIADHLAQVKLNEVLHQDASKVQAAIARVNQQMFQASHQGSRIYLLESDPFYFYYLTQNIVEHGRMAEQIKGSKYFDPLMRAPFGTWQPMTYHPYVGFVLYKIFKLFNPNISLIAALAYTPLVVVVLVLAAFFLTCRILECSAATSFVASLFFVLAPVILKRSSLGWYDTDPYNLLFCLLVLTVLLKAIGDSHRENLWGYAVVLALVLTAFAAIWPGWGFMLATALVILGAGGVYSFLHKNILSARYYTLLGAAIVGTTILGIGLLFGFNDFLPLLKEGLEQLQKFTVQGLSLWPNLFMEVGELKKSSMQDVISDSGGLFFLSAAMISFLYTIYQALKNRPVHHTLKVLALSLFFAISALLTISAERFVIFALIGLSLFLALGLETLVQWLSSRKIPWLGAGAVILLTLFVLINAGHNIRVVLTPIFNSAWEKALVDIKNKTPPDSIVNTWWPPGHFIKAIAHRRVMFDGASLNESATGYWMANILLSTDEDQAAGLLRMINVSGNKAVDFLTAKGLKTSRAVALLSTIASKTNQEARGLLQAVFHNDEDVQTLLALIRGGFPHSYVLLYNELVDENLGLAFMGRWNIQRMEMLNDNPSLLASVPARNSAAYLDFLWDLAGGQTHYSPPLALLAQNDKILFFNENLFINPSTMQAAINSPLYGHGILASVVYLNNGQILEKTNPQANLKYAVVLYSQDGRMMARLMDRSLANSLLVKLFFFDGVGLQHFKPLTSASDLTGRTQIKVFELKGYSHLK
ncbi:MAG: hypothetical protein HY209_05435 [Candidatus Omnitrophica bacterium]|nr:hypothetical protein [Candidatus Omnitrophota bacterium]